MRKSIDVEAVTASLVNAHRSKLWRNKVEDLIKSVVVASTEYKSGYQQQLKEELEFANANLDLLSEEDYKWLLEQQKSPTTKTTKDALPSFNCKLCCDGYFSASDVQGKLKDELTINSPEFKEALANAPFVCKIHDNSDVAVMDKFKEVVPGFTAVNASGVVKKARKARKVYFIQDKKTKQYVTKVDHSYFTEVDLDKDIFEARLYTSKNLADDDCNFLSRYKDTDCKVQLEVVEMPDDEKFVLWSNGCNEFFVRIDSTGIKTTKHLDEATRYVSYKSASTAVKKTDKELPYRFSISTVKNVKPLVVPVEKPVKKVKEPKVKEEWVLYINGMNGVPWYYNGEINVPSYHSTNDLKDAVKFSSYGAATKAKCKLIKAGFITLDVANVEDCK